MSDLTTDVEQPPRATPLDGLHRALGARMVVFAGYWMPVQYADGIMAEHQHCRTAAALFDVSHMGQATLSGRDPVKALERLVTGDIQGLKPGRQRYTLLTNEAGGIQDDLMATRLAEDRLFLVVNAARKDADFRTMAATLPEGAVLKPAEDDRAMLALQGPQAAEVLGRLAPDLAVLPFMAAAETRIGDVPVIATRSGYTGEDGFEISLPAEHAEALARRLLEQPEVKPAGLGARDSLRLEAGLCLYGNDIDEVTTPVEAGLTWAIGKRRRVLWDFVGAAPIRDHFDNGAPRLRVGIRPDGPAPARDGTVIAAEDGTSAGTITSGGFSPTLGMPIAMGYVRRDLAADGTPLSLVVRGKTLPARVSPLPFVPHRFVR